MKEHEISGIKIIEGSALMTDNAKMKEAIKEVLKWERINWNKHKRHKIPNHLRKAMEEAIK